MLRTKDNYYKYYNIGMNHITNYITKCPQKSTECLQLLINAGEIFEKHKIFIDNDWLMQTIIDCEIIRQILEKITNASTVDYNEFFKNNKSKLTNNFVKKFINCYFAYCKNKTTLIDFVVDDPDFYADNHKIYLKEISSIPVLSTEEMIYLAKQKDKGDLDARKKLIESNLRLVPYVARRYLNKGVSLSDLIQEGNLGLMEAVDRFDYTKGFKFSTYADYWIKKYVILAIQKTSRTVNMPIWVNREIHKIKKAKEKLTAELQRTPTNNELASRLNISLKRLTKLQSNVIINKSLSEELNELEDKDLEDCLKSDFFPAPEESICDEIFVQEFIPDFAKFLKTLDDRRRTIVELYFGLGGNQSLLLDEIGEIFNISGERVRVLRNEGLNAIKLKFVKKGYTIDLPSRTKSLKRKYQKPQMKFYYNQNKDA